MNSEEEIVSLKSNEAILNQLHDDLKNNADSNNKIKLNTPNFPSVYLPSIMEALRLLGFPSNEKQLIDLLEATYEIKLDISRTSKYEFFNKGVGLRTFGKIVVWAKSLPMSFVHMANKKLMAKAIRAAMYGSNGGDWLSAIHSFEASFSRHSDEGQHEFIPLFELIEYRCKTETALYSNIKQQIQAGELNTSNKSAVWQQLKPLWLSSPFIPGSICTNHGLLIEKVKETVLNQQESLTLMEGFCYFTFDFYMQAITRYEIGCRFYFGKNEDKVKNELGIITKAISTYAEGNCKTCFDGMLIQLKDALTELVGKTSFRTIASFIDIEIDDSKVVNQTLADKQYNQLKDWRNGKNLPSTNKLIVFLKNMDAFAKTDSGYLTMLMCKISMGIDTLIAEVVAKSIKESNCDISSINAEKTIQKVLANIPNYYQENLKNHKNKMNQQD